LSEKAEAGTGCMGGKTERPVLPLDKGERGVTKQMELFASLELVEVI
jgi:hypothetical protein